MKVRLVFAGASIMLLAAALIGTGQQRTATDQPVDVSALVGNWSGTSRCKAKDTACHDETVVYHIKEIRDKPGLVSVDADRIVDGKPINMGSLEFKYEQAEHTLICRYSQGVWRFKIAGEMMDGTLTRDDGTEFRRVNLRRQK